MSARPVGLLLDAHSGDLGDRAIRQAMEQFLTAEAIPYELISSPEPDPSRYRALVIGRKGLRLTGAHVLNAVSVGGEASFDHLAPYLYVSVCSSADASRVRTARSDVAVVPSLATGLVEAATRSETRDLVGIHFTAQSFAADFSWHEHLRRLPDLGKIYLPFTDRDEERGILARLMHAVGEGRLSGARSPTEVFATVGGLRLFICSSLTAALFAYLQNIPFLVFADASGVTDYLTDRGLSAWTFRTANEMLVKAERILDATPDYRELIERDRERLRKHFLCLRDVLRNGASISVPDSLRAPSFGAPHYRFEGSPLLRRAAPPGTFETNLQSFATNLEKELNRLHREVASQCARIEELAGSVDRLQNEFVYQLNEVARRETLLQEIRKSRAYRLATSLQELALRLRRMIGRAPS